LLECLAHVALAGLTALSWLGLGSLVLMPLEPTGDRLLEAINRIGAGVLAFALLTFGAGWLGLLHAAAYLPVFCLSALAGGIAAFRLLRGVPLPRFSRWPWWQLALAALLGVYLLIDVVATCAPISSADALYHHAAAPELFEQRHRLVELPWSWNSYQPYTVEMLVLDGFLLWDSVQGAFAPLLLAFAALATVVGAAERLAGRGVALLAGAIVFAQPFMVWMATSTFVEPGLAFLLALAGWNLVRYAQRGQIGSLVLAGAFAGGAAGVKYPGAAAAFLLAVAGAVLLWRRLTLARALAFALPALAIALPWYVKNAILTGNPVYPFVFGGANPEATEAAFESFESYGHGQSALDLLLLPARMLADAEAFDRGEFISPLFLLFAPLAFLYRPARRPAAVVWILGIAFTLSWFFGSQHSRFLVPLMPAFAVLAALGIVALTRRGRLGRIIAVGATVGALVTGFGVSVVYAAQFVPVVIGTQSEREFLTQKSSYYEGIDWLNANLPPDARVVIDHVFALHVDRPTVVWTADVLESTAGPAASLAFFDRYGLTHAAVFATNTPRRRQLGYADAREIARVTVRPVISRTLSEVGPPETMLVYALPGFRPSRSETSGESLQDRAGPRGRLRGLAGRSTDRRAPRRSHPPRL